MDNKLLAWGMRPGVASDTPMARRSLSLNVIPRHPVPRDIVGQETRPEPLSVAAAGAILPGMPVRPGEVVFRRSGGRPRVPRLWLFTDDKRLPNPRAAVARLPPNAAGVILRHDADPQRAALGRDLARICRQRRLLLVVAGDSRLAAALGAGVHLRGGRWPAPIRLRGVITSSAHSVAELRRAARAGARLVFLSPAFPTASHAGAPGLGPLRWAAMGRHAGTSTRLAALGGMNGNSVRRLPADLCQAVGAIDALS
ncbi:thiamine phosphate synthase [Rhodopila sp.]|uniref:thiamine phosphate synthase n=1 Tax=Rhodopila sp. TaxID=2480087 RepID=UPI003D0BE6CB